MTDFNIRDSDRRLTRRGAQSGTKLVPENTILMVVRGMSLKSEFRMGITRREVALSQDLKGLKPHDDLDPLFLAYALRARTPDVLDMVDEAGHGTGRLQTDRLYSLEIPFPEGLDEQRAIAATLSALDDKIESNRRVAEAIPSLIRAKVDEALADSIDELAVARLANFVNGGAYTKDATGSGRIVIRIADLNSGPGPSTVYNELEVPEDKTACPGDILMSWSGSLGVYRWARDEAIVNQHIFKVIPSNYPSWLVFDRLDHVISVFQGIAKDKATTMGHIQRGHLESTVIAVPTQSAIEQLDLTLSHLWERHLVAEQEIFALQRLRDALLPELLSGRIRVPAEVAA